MGQQWSDQVWLLGARWLGWGTEVGYQTGDGIPERMGFQKSDEIPEK